MLFSSYTFLFQFLPATVLAFAAARRHSPRAGILVLVGASLFFYGAWQPVYLLLFAASVAVNFGLGLRMEDPLRRRSIRYCSPKQITAASMSTFPIAAANPTSCVVLNC